jgi:hypothetical protein
MSHRTLVFIISLAIILFILFKGAVGLVCTPAEPNSVANVISSVVPAPQANTVEEKRDPLSWEPVINQLIKLITKVCPN